MEVVEEGMMEEVNDGLSLLESGTSQWTICWYKFEWLDECAPLLASPPPSDHNGAFEL
jgi:hypothetical protein